MFIQNLFEADGAPRRLVVTYPGRFQPFHKGHRDVFANLQRMFGRDNVFIVTSNKTDAVKSPFNFGDKVRFMHAMGIPDDRVIETDKVYDLPPIFADQKPHVVFVTVVGAPDAKRLNPGATKKDGSPAYFQQYPGKLEDMQSADQHGYVIVEPEHPESIVIGGQKYDVSHGTPCRALWNQVRNNPQQRAEFIQQLYGRNDPDLGHILDKIPAPAAPTAPAESIGESVDEGREEALQFATQAHAGQKRAGGAPYISHPVRVAQHVEQWKQSHNIEALISAAYLHDTLEDTDTTHEALHDLFGGLVASLVQELTSDKAQIEKMGKQNYLAHKMAAMSSYALVIKLADRLDNVKDIATARTPEWRARYAAETNHILDFIEKNRALSGTHQKLIGLIRDKLQELNNPQGVTEDAAGVGMVKNSKDPRYVMATMGDQNDVDSKTLGKMMKAYHLTGVRAPKTQQTAVKGNIAESVRDHNDYREKIEKLQELQKRPGLSHEEREKIRDGIHKIEHAHHLLTMESKMNEAPAQKHTVLVTVSDPNGTMVSKRKELRQRRCNVTAPDRETAVNSAIAWYRKQGYKVHDHHYVGPVPAQNEATDAVSSTQNRADGSPYDRGVADGYYGRRFNPHKYVGLPNGNRQRVDLTDPAEVAEYKAGYNDDSYGSKDYGESVEQGVAEGCQDDSKEREENLRYSRSRNPVADAIRKKLNPNQKEQGKEQGVAEGSELKQAKRKYNQAARDANADQVGAGKKIDTMKNSLRQRDVDNKKQGVVEAFQNDESNLFYRYDTADSRLKQKMIDNLDERAAKAQGYRETPEQALRVHNIIRSKFNPKKWVQNQGGKWVEVFPFGQPAGTTEAANPAQQAAIAIAKKKHGEVDEDMYQYDKADPFNSEFAPRAGMGRMTLRGWKQSLARRVAELSQQMTAGADPSHIDNAAIWDNVYRKMQSLNLDPIAQEIELAHQELERIRQRGGIRSRAFKR